MCHPGIVLSPTTPWYCVSWKKKYSVKCLKTIRQWRWVKDHLSCLRREIDEKVICNLCKTLDSFSFTLPLSFMFWLFWLLTIAMHYSLRNCIICLITIQIRGWQVVCLHKFKQNTKQNPKKILISVRSNLFCFYRAQKIVTWFSGEEKWWQYSFLGLYGVYKEIL